MVLYGKCVQYIQPASGRPASGQPGLVTPPRCVLTSLGVTIDRWRSFRVGSRSQLPWQGASNRRTQKLNQYDLDLNDHFTRTCLKGKNSYPAQGKK
jgi:hypothetical protein